MKVILLASAKSDLTNIFEFILPQQPKAARKVFNALIYSTQQIALFPEMGRGGRIKGTRELVLPDIPFVIVYEVVEFEIRILAVIHASREWPEKI